jgi:hypothetical protein
MERRDFLKATGGLSAYLIVGDQLLSIRKAEADTGLPIAALQASLDPKNDVVLIPVTKTIRQFDISCGGERRDPLGHQQRTWLCHPLGRSFL